MSHLNKTKIKICGIKEIDTLDCCIKNNVDYFGLIFYKKSPRNINYKEAMKLISYSKSKKISSVGVFVNESTEDLKNILKSLNIGYVQLHGKEDNEYIKLIKKNNKKIKIIKSIPINSSKVLLKLENYPIADIFLFDYIRLKIELPGGNAKTFNWNFLRNKNIIKPWFLSGGINIKNINEIKNYIIPYGIDISSGVEDRLGIKSNEKISMLIKKYESK
jgi:phosphoribosylanthranilate isomerase